MNASSRSAGTQQRARSDAAHRRGPQLPDMIRILDGGRLVASRPVIDERRQYRIDPAHRQGAPARTMRHGDAGDVIISRRGDHVARRSLAFYQAIG